MGVYRLCPAGFCGDYLLRLCAVVPLWHEGRVAGVPGGGAAYHGGDGDGTAKVVCI